MPWWGWLIAAVVGGYATLVVLWTVVFAALWHNLSKNF